VNSRDQGASNRPSKEDLSGRFFTAEAAIWLLSATLVLSNFIGIAANQNLPLVNLALQRGEDFHRVVALLLLGAITYLLVEWKQSSVRARSEIWARVRLGLAVAFGVFALNAARDSILAGTEIARVDPLWYVAFASIGILAGHLTAVLILAALMVRSKESSAELGLRRWPIASQAQFKIWGPMLLATLGAYQLFAVIGPMELLPYVPWLTGIPLATLVVSVAPSMTSERLNKLRRAADMHEYMIDLPRRAAKGRIARAARSARSSDGDTTRFSAMLNEDVRLEMTKQGAPCSADDPHVDGVQVVETKGEVNVSVALEGYEESPKRLAISLQEVERWAQLYLKQNPGRPIDYDKLMSFALNQATIVAMRESVPDSLAQAARLGLRDDVLALIGSDVDVNQKDHAGWTPVMYAAAENQIAIARDLLQAGGDPDAINLLGRTSLMFAANYGYEEICRLLLEFGAATDLRDEHGDTALMRAIEARKEAIAMLLIEAGTDLSLRNKDGQVALDIAQITKQGTIAKSIRQAVRQRKGN
jgi:hypothetical protein